MKAPKTTLKTAALRTVPTVEEIRAMSPLPLAESYRAAEWSNDRKRAALETLLRHPDAAPEDLLALSRQEYIRGGGGAPGGSKFAAVVHVAAAKFCVDSHVKREGCPVYGVQSMLWHGGDNPAVATLHLALAMALRVASREAILTALRREMDQRSFSLILAEFSARGEPLPEANIRWDKPAKKKKAA